MSSKQSPRRLTDTELTTQHAGYHDSNAIESMVVELRERRAADLTSGDVEQLLLAAAVLCEMRDKVADSEFRARLHIVDEVIMRVATSSYKQTPLYRAALTEEHKP